MPKDNQKFGAQVKPLEKNLSGPIAEKQRRLRKRPNVSFPENLPITARKSDIIDAIKNHPVVIIAGDTGSGKSTQIPKMCIAAGRGIDGKIACTQPRRIAATTIAGRIAEELGETIGKSVGYKIRFKDRTSRGAYIKVLTDGMLLAETQQNPRLTEYDTIIVDEAHERSLNIDFILGILKKLIKKRKDLKLIITSATIDTEKFSKGFGDAPVIQVSGRRYPVSVQYRPVDPELQEKGERTYVEAAVEVTEGICGSGAFGDILIFMPTEQDILETCERLAGRELKNITVLPLFARLPGSQQAKVFAPAKGRKVIVSTNVAETSLTIPGIKYVVDTGLARISRYVPRTRSTSLPISPISRSSADQREGRCGRLENGICVRLYSREDYESRPEFTEPEILRSNLAEVILRMISLKLGKIEAFPFLDKPNPRSIKDGFDLLVELGAVIRTKGGAPSLTPRGRMMSRMPIDPKISRMILEAESNGCIYDVAVIASALSIQDPKERPLEKAAQADQVHGQFKDSASDFITLLNIWNRYHRSWEALGTQNKMRKFCKAHFLSFARLREWRYIHEQISNILKSQGIRNENRQKDEKDRYAAIHQSVLSGYLSNIAIKKDKNIYLAARGREAMLFPGSTLFNKSPDWIVAVEMVKTSRLFARTAAKIDPQWLETLGGSLCKSTYANPHWEKKAGQVRAYEQVTLYGLVIVSNRSVSYGAIDPALSHKIFLRSALVEGEMNKKFSFLVHNQALIDEITKMEEKVRRRGIRVSDERMEAFYSSRLQGVCDIRTLEKTIRNRGGDDFLKMTEADVIARVPDREEVAQYPDEMDTGNGIFKFSYRFKPGKPDDGVTLKVPLNQASQVSPHQLDWMVPGLFREKITALLKSLPKRYRKQLVPVSGTVEIILSEMEKSEDPLLSTLGSFIYKRFGVDIPATAWADAEIPEHLRMRVSILDHQNRELKSARDTSILNSLPETDRHKPGNTSEDAWKKAKTQWEKESIVTWNFKTLPETISLAPRLVAFPALSPAENSVEIRLFPNGRKALESHLVGVRKLFMLHFRKELKLLKKDLKIPTHLSSKTIDFGGPGSVETAMFDALMARFFNRNIRTETAFEKATQAVASEIFPTGRRLLELTTQVLSAYHHAMRFIHQMAVKNKSNPSAAGLCRSLLAEMGALVPRDFLERYDMAHLAHLPRYLRALEIRAERGVYNPDKDREKEALMEPLKAVLKKNLQSITSGASPEKRRAFEAFFWMVEEYKVSVFAQELKTAIPVSAKRLDEQMRALERMV